MVDAYMHNTQFHKFVKACLAIPFLPMGEIYDAVKKEDGCLISFQFDRSSEQYQEMVNFKDHFLQYMADYWLTKFPLKVCF